MHAMDGPVIIIQGNIFQVQRTYGNDKGQPGEFFYSGIRALYKPGVSRFNFRIDHLYAG